MRVSLFPVLVLVNKTVFLVQNYGMKLAEIRALYNVCIISTYTLTKVVSNIAFFVLKFCELLNDSTFVSECTQFVFTTLTSSTGQFD